MVCIAPISAIVSFVAILVSVNTIFRSVVLFAIAIARMRAQTGKLILVTAGVFFTIVPAGGTRIAAVVAIVAAPKTAASINDRAACSGLIKVVISLTQRRFRHAIGRR